MLDLDGNGVDFLNEIRVVARQVSQVAEILDGLFTSSTLNEPSRRLLDDDRNENGEKTGWDELYGERCEPLSKAHREIEGDTIIYPETDDTANLPCNFVHADELTADLRGSNFRDVQWGHRRRLTDTDTCNSTTGENRTETTRSVGSQHDCATSKANDCSNEHAILAAEEKGYRVRR